MGLHSVARESHFSTVQCVSEGLNFDKSERTTLHTLVFLTTFNIHINILDFGVSCLQPTGRWRRIFHDESQSHAQAAAGAPHCHWNGAIFPQHMQPPTQSNLHSGSLAANFPK